MKKIIQIICLLITTGLFAQTNFIDSTTTSPKRIILLDAGHGGTDTGVKREEFQEKDIVLKIATVIQEKNPFENIEFVLLRKGDEQIINTNRAKLINEIKPDLVLSLHANYNVKDSKKGTEIHLSPLNPTFEESKILGEKIGNNISNLGFENLGIVESNAKILRDSQVPIVMIEIGYLTNIEDRKLLTNEENYPKIADKIFEALKN
ncbi:N-acetylmuramoyl-L-alanine amidase [Empedobacter falsenii]|uniref:N-acetylmuramoyl-L-alanine amidase family protein n=1 Tax=Empedobacter stercoris TaxID=1628248 RepID=UPI001CE16521|nr:N-acetylmuramoyl-L-alanine amidase [Empedobacter stercoris]MCA4782829.1 N-acetylmuramoyl-L-alanine amidase [Empedobacter stercoris]